MTEQKEHNNLIWDLQDLMSRYGVTRSAISDWSIKNPDMKLYKGEPLPKGRYNILASDYAYIQHLKDKLENVGSRAKKIEVETEKLQEQILLLKLERYEKQKKLMPIELVGDEVTSMLMVLKKGLQGIPSRLSKQLSGMTKPTEICDILTKEIDGYLQNACDEINAIVDNNDPEFIELMRCRYGDLWQGFDESRKESFDV